MQILANSTNAAINLWIYRTMASRNLHHLRGRINHLLLLMAFAILLPIILGSIYIRLFMEEPFLEAIPLISLYSRCFVFHLPVLTVFGD